MTRQELINCDAVWARFYRDGKSLGEIAQEFGCSVYQLSPWLTSPVARAALRASDEAPDSAWSAVRAAVLDWFTLPPKYRTKKRLLEMVRLPSPEKPSN